MKRAVVLVILAGTGMAITVSACTPAIDQAKLAAVQVVGVDSAVRGCRLLGQIEGRDNDRWVPGGPKYETAMLDLRKKAVSGGGNYLVTDAIETPRDGDYNPVFVVRARLFACETGGAHASHLGRDRPAARTAADASGACRRACPAADAVASRRPRPPPAPICEPDCSPGYTCLRGTCVSACNPLCASGERCGADRVCHAVTSLPTPAPLPR